MVADIERRRDGEEEIGKMSRKTTWEIKRREMVTGRRDRDRGICRENDEKNKGGRKQRIEQIGKTGERPGKGAGRERVEVRKVAEVGSKKEQSRERWTN